MLPGCYCLELPGIAYASIYALVSSHIGSIIKSVERANLLIKEEENGKLQKLRNTKKFQIRCFRNRNGRNPDAWLASKIESLQPGNRRIEERE